jgi:hypothetical protein
MFVCIYLAFLKYLWEHYNIVLYNRLKVKIAFKVLLTLALGLVCIGEG